MIVIGHFRCRRAAQLALAGLVWATGAQAQVSAPNWSPLSLAECLTPASAVRGQPEYPASALALKVGGAVDVELVFDGPDSAPKMELVGQEQPDPALVRSVREHVRAYRLPCLPKQGTPVRMRRIFEFITQEQQVLVQSSRLREAKTADVPPECLVRVEPGSRPQYPQRSLEKDVQGKLYMRVRFTQADAPPEVSTIASNGDGWLLHEVTSFFAGYRMPCLAAGQDKTVRMLFDFKIQGARRVVLTNATLKTWLSVGRDVPVPAHFDLDQMGCPFDVALAYWRPHAPNEVAEIGAPHPGRRVFLDWLADIALNVDERRNTSLLGDTATIHVPCGRVALDAEPASTPMTDSSRKPQE